MLCCGVVLLCGVAVLWYAAAGYGAAFLPMSAGRHMIDIPCWRPVSSSSLVDRVSEWLLGGHPTLNDPSVVTDAGDRSALHAVTTGVVTVRS